MNDQKTIRVLIVDDHEMVRRGLGMFLRNFDDLVMVGEARNGEEAIQQCGELAPDVILMDIVMPVMNGIEAMRIIQDRFPTVKMIALTSASDGGTITDLLQAGANSYLLKNISDDQLADAIRATYAGQAIFSPEATQAIINMAIHPSAPDYDLSEREIEVLRYLVQGCSNLEIAQKIFLSRSTVKYHVRNILIKLDAKSRSELVAIALKYKLIK